jgi:hypothetical protein
MTKIKVVEKIVLSVAKFNLEEEIEFKSCGDGFRANLTSEKYFGGIEFVVSATGKTVLECGARLVVAIISHPAFDPEWKFKEGMRAYIVYACEDDPQAMHVNQKKFEVWAMDPREAKEQIKKYDKWLEVVRIE